MTKFKNLKALSANSTFAIGGISSFADSLVVAESFVLRINISGKKPAHRKSANRQAVKKPHIPYNSPFKIASLPHFKHHIRHSF